MLQILTNSREKENSSIPGSSCREGLTVGRGNGELTRSTVTPQGHSAEHLLSCLPVFFRKMHTFMLTSEILGCARSPLDSKKDFSWYKFLFSVCVWLVAGRAGVGEDAQAQPASPFPLLG